MNNKYGPLDLLINIIYIPKQSVFKKLKYFLGFMIFYATSVALLNYKFNLIPEQNELGQFHLLFSFCLTIIIGFRINVAYSRWWEARGLWGNLVNNSRHLAIKLNRYIGLENDPDLKSYIAEFPLLLKYHLQHDISSAKSLIEQLGIKDEEENLPNLLIQKILNKIDYYRASNQISFEQFLTLDSHVFALSDTLGGCEKILNTLPPPGFAAFTKFALLFYIIIFPFGWVHSFELFITPIIVVIIYVLLGLEIIAEEIELPFGSDFNCLPLDDFVNNIRKNVKQIAKMNRD